MNATAQILEALDQRHKRESNGDTPAWIFTTELTVGVGLSGVLRPHEQAAFADAGHLHVPVASRLDAFALHTWPSRNLERIAYEVKVSRSDLLRELKYPNKRAAGMALSNLFYLVVHADVQCLKEEVPEGVGLMRWHPEKGLRIVVRAPYRQIPDPPINFMLSLMRTVQKRAQKDAL